MSAPLTEGRRFSKESAIYTAGEILSKAFTFLLVPVYASYLSLDDMAVWGLVTMIWPFALILLGKGFSGYIMRGYYDAEDKKEFVGTLMVFSMLIGSAVALLLHLLGPFLADLIFKDVDYRPYLQYGIYFALFRLFFLHVVSVFRAKREAMKSIQLTAIQFVLYGLAVIVSIVLFKTDLKGIFDAQIYAYVIISLIYLLILSKEMRMSFNKSWLRPSLHFALPLLSHGIAGWAVVYIGRPLIQRLLTVEDLAVFTVATTVAAILSVINNGLNQAWMPFIYANAGDTAFAQLYRTNGRKLVLMSVWLGCGLYLASPELLRLMGKVEYMKALTLMPWLIAAYCFQLIYFLRVALLLQARQTKPLPMISISAGLLAVVCNILLIPVWGITGAAVSTFASFGLMVLIVHGLTRKQMPILLLTKEDVIFIAMAMLLSYFGDHLAYGWPLWGSIPFKAGVMGIMALILDRLGLVNIRHFFSMFLKRQVDISASNPDI